MSEVKSAQKTKTPMSTEELEARAQKHIKKFGSISNAIRGLASNGMKTGEIARELNKRYQHVRNVLKKPLKREQSAESAGTNEHKGHKKAA